MSPITLTGRVARDAEARTTPEGQWHVVVRIELPAVTGQKPMPLQAIQQMGSGTAAALAARSRAHHLRRGVRVTVEAAAICWARGLAKVDASSTLHTPDLHIGRSAGLDR